MRFSGSSIVAVLSLVAGCSGWSTTSPVPELPVVALPWVGAPVDASITGTVRDGAGRPIDGAQVCAWDLSEGRLSNEDRTPQCTLAGSDGAYSLVGLTAAARRVQASAPSFHAEVPGPVVPLLAGQRRDAVDLVLVAGGVALRGQVVDADGRPIAGAWVSSSSVDSDSAEPAATGTHSEAEGRFALWVRPGRQNLSADAAGFSATMTQVDTTSAPGRLVMTPAAELHGAVVDAVTGAPLAGVRVQAIVEEEMMAAATAGLAYTDAAGTFRITRLRPGTFRLRAQTGNRIGAGDRAFVLGVGQMVFAPTLALSSAPLVRGQVVVTGSDEPCREGSVIVGELPGEAIGPDGEVFISSLDPGEHNLEVDVLLANTAPPRDAATPWVAHAIAEQPVSLVGPPTRTRRKRSLKELLSSEPLVLPTAESSIRAGFDALVNRLGVHPRIAAEVDDMAMLRLLARERIGLAVVPTIVVRDELEARLLVEIAPLPQLKETFFAITLARRFPNPLLKVLIPPGDREKPSGESLTVSRS